ncbi:DNA-formamidopyrimidine glycosylase family protein [Nocardioides sp. InS609-2]|uniref:Fpg/Nei family DNA glycosylase n=1 Tax=Nocardioides sp. InS609-2 TaxID=2760705 RepID=UPI0020C1881C|nr:DNA-formamidopyrimidine glycosylase family protein [Nocardioides sp. InS609-2]
MPEGDTVWRAARTLDRALAGHVLTASDFRVPQLATADLSGSRVVCTLSRGKHLLTRLQGGETGGADWTLHTHLKMEGGWEIYTLGQRWRRPAKDARVVLTTDERVVVGFSLGIVELVPRHEEQRVVGHLGPDLLGPDWNEEEALRRLRQDQSRPLGEALLDQTSLAGIGNMYASELCFTSGVHPLTPVGEVDDLPRLVRRARQMLDHNKERAEQTTTGDLRRGRRMWVYRRDEQPCLRCQTPIKVHMQGDPGKERAKYWCPSCQPAPG